MVIVFVFASNGCTFSEAEQFYEMMQQPD